MASCLYGADAADARDGGCAAADGPFGGGYGGGSGGTDVSASSCAGAPLAGIFERLTLSLTTRLGAAGSGAPPPLRQRQQNLQERDHVDCNQRGGRRRGVAKWAAAPYWLGVVNYLAFLAQLVHTTVCGPRTDGTGSLAFESDAECRAWVLRNPLLAAKLAGMGPNLAWLVAFSPALLAVVLAHQPGSLGRIGPSIVWTLKGLCFRLHGVLVLFAVRCGIDTGMHPYPVLTWAMRSMWFIIGGLCESAITNNLAEHSFAIKLAADCGIVVLNMCLLLLMAEEEGGAYLRSPMVFLGAAAAPLTVPMLHVVMPRLSSLLQRLQQRRRMRLAAYPARTHAGLLENWAPLAMAAMGACDSALKPQKSADPLGLAQPEASQRAEGDDEGNFSVQRSADEPAAGAHSDDSPTYDVPYTRMYPTTVRLVFKINGREPEDLLEGWQASLVRAAEPHGRVRSVAVRRGCTQLVVDVDADGADALLNRMAQMLAGSEAGGDRGGGSDGWSVPALFHDTRSCHMSVQDSRNTQRTSDARPLPSVLCARPAVAELQMCTSPTAEATLVLSAPMPPGCVLTARHAFEGYLTVACADAARDGLHVRVVFAAPSRPGRVHFEVVDEASGQLGAAAWQLLLPSGQAAEDLMQVVSRGADAAAHPVVEDVGAWVDAAIAARERGFADNAARAEAERVCAALVGFCRLVRLPGLRDMLLALHEQIEGTRSGPHAATVAPPPPSLITRSIAAAAAAATAPPSPAALTKRARPAAAAAAAAATAPPPLPATAAQLAPSAAPLRPSPLVVWSACDRFTVARLLLQLGIYVARIPLHLCCFAIFYLPELLLIALMTTRAFVPLPHTVARAAARVEKLCKQRLGVLAAVQRSIAFVLFANGIPVAMPKGMLSLVATLAYNVADSAFTYIPYPVQPPALIAAAACANGVSFTLWTWSHEMPHFAACGLVAAVGVVAVHVWPAARHGRLCESAVMGKDRRAARGEAAAAKMP
uniref:Uncharacterized protein n=1 Tax=Chlamydomonas euryale TaxID=1486919 RepID=A0A7R9VCY4_9CHLO|mmetsp:Transcript_3198/g.8817  ORF Transcript_3198/g.8817 Transcript_3198/m.8817 type:complete len:988 (+) Transcript_3198:330-3293(+)